MYKLIKDNDNVYFIIMENVFGHNSNDLDYMYDLKGSHYGRECSKEDLKKKDSCRKDINFENDIMQGNIAFEIDIEFKEKFEEQLAKDVEFFKTNNIIDYSLIVGFVKHDKLNTSNITVSNSDLKANYLTAPSLFRHCDNLDSSSSEEE